MKMDWKALGYEREYKDGRFRWVPQQDNKTPEDQDGFRGKEINERTKEV